MGNGGEGDSGATALVGLDGFVVTADFPTLEDAMTALDAEDFQNVKAATVAISPSRREGGYDA